LTFQRDRRDAVGELARLVAADPAWPGLRRRDGLTHYLVERGAPETILQALSQAYAEWEAVRGHAAPIGPSGLGVQTPSPYPSLRRLLVGTVVSGMGNFSYWIQRLEDHYYRKTGVHLFPGTLNLRLEQPYSLPSGVLRLEKEEYGGTVSVNILRCRIFGRPAFILRTDANEQGRGHHPKTILDIASEVKLREVYGLQDGDRVTVEVSA
jgi:riboflavin kinase